MTFLLLNCVVTALAVGVVAAPIKGPGKVGDIKIFDGDSKENADSIGGFHDDQWLSTKELDERIKTDDEDVGTEEYWIDLGEMNSGWYSGGKRKDQRKDITDYRKFKEMEMEKMND
jgi:hypothetical protein